MPTIIISGQPGAGSSTTAKLLAKALDMKHWSAGEYTKQFGKSVKETERAVEAWHGKAATKEYHVGLDEKVVEVAKAGNVVIDGKLAIHFAARFADFTVWLKCPHRVRAQRLAVRDKISLSEADRVLDEKEKLERLNWQKMYGFDPFEQETEADVVIDTSTMAPKEIVEKIKKDLEKLKILD
jgi:cytidylate kinase